MKPIHIKWVLAHEPIDIFIRAAEKFAEVADARAPGQFNIEVLTLSQYSEKYNNGTKISKHNLLDIMDTGAVEMSQMYTYVLSKYNQDLDALDLPFLFRDHDHAARVFEGEIGESLLNGYAKNSNIKGMAFTYSGGFINMPMNQKISNLSEMAGVKVRVSNSPVAAATWLALGAEPIVMDVEHVTDGMREGVIAGGESSWPRIYACKQNEVADIILEPNHRLLLTNIIMNKNFLNQLPEHLQQVMKDAALEAGRFERAVAVAEVAPTKARCKQDGINIIKFSHNDEQIFRQITAKVYTEFADVFSSGLVYKIQKA